MYLSCVVESSTFISSLDCDDLLVSLINSENVFFLDYSVQSGDFLHHCLHWEI